MLSLCVTCKDRFWQLEQTLPYNLKFCRDYGYELCLLDYGSSESLHPWIQENFTEYLDLKILKFKRVEARAYHCSKAKNLSHHMASNEILGNLDCDNFLNEQVMEIVQKIIKEPNLVIQNWSGDYPDGTFGRIFLTKKSFQDLGGYDERMGGLTYQDNDLLSRAKAHGAKVKQLKFKGDKYPVFNSRQEKEASLGGGLQYMENMKKNKWIYFFNRWKGITLVNSNKKIFKIHWGLIYFVYDCFYWGWHFFKWQVLNKLYSIIKHRVYFKIIHTYQDLFSTKPDKPE